MRERSKGSVLLVSLWALTALTGLVTAQAGTLGSSWRLWSHQRQTLEAFDLAREGFAHGLAALQEDDDWLWDAPAELWAKPQAGEVGSENIWMVTVQDEGGKLNLNAVPWTVIAHLPDSSVNLAQAVVARCHTAPLGSLAELALVDGMTPERLARWKPLVRTFGLKEVNLNTAPQGVLEALGLPASTAEALITYRNDPDGLAGTKDEQFFRRSAEIAPAISKFLHPEEVAVLMNLVNQGMLGVRSGSFQVIATGKSGTVQRIVTALVDRPAVGSRFQVRGWHETAAPSP